MNRKTNFIYLAKTSIILVILALMLGLTIVPVMSAPPGSLAVVVQSSTNQATILDLSVEPPTVLTTLSVGSTPIDVATSPDGTIALVANISSGNVSVIDLTTLSVSATISVSGQPSGIGISPDGTTAVVGTSNTTDLSILDLTVSPPVVSSTISVGSGIFGDARDVVITADSQYAIVAFGDSFEGQALVVDLSLTPPQELVSERIPVGFSPLAIGTNPAHTIAVIPSISSDDVTVLDLSSFPFSSKGTIPVGNNPGSKPDISDSGLAIIPNSDDDTITVLDVSGVSPSLVATLPVGTGPRGAAIIDSDNVVLVANRDNSTVSRYDLTTLTPLSTISSIGSANHIAVYEPSSDPECLIDAPTSINEGDPFTATLSCTNLTDVYGFEYAQSVSPTSPVITPVTSTFVNGDIFSAASTLTLVNDINDSFAQSLQSPESPVSGDFDLGSLTYNTDDPGVATLDLDELILGDINGIEILASTVASTDITIVDLLLASVSGTARRETGADVTSAISILADGISPDTMGTANGFFSFVYDEETVALDASLTVNAPGHVSCLTADLGLTDDTLNILTPITLLAGDVDNNDLIDITDGSIIVQERFLPGSAPVGTTPDLNEDGSITILDLIHVGRNFGSTGPSACQ